MVGFCRQSHFENSGFPDLCFNAGSGRPGRQISSSRSSTAWRKNVFLETLVAGECAHLQDSVCLSVCLSTCLYVDLSVGLSVYLSVCLSVCLYFSWYVCLSVCLSVFENSFPWCFDACRIFWKNTYFCRQNIFEDHFIFLLHWGRTVFSKWLGQAYLTFKITGSGRPVFSK